jgi:catechol 2,3-dioxygenase-like lactoylglutathione lyase family enzyme
MTDAAAVPDACLPSGDAGKPSATGTVTTPPPDDVRIEALSAITLATRDMARAVRFYSALGFELKHGGELEPFTTFACGTASYLNLIAETHGPVNWWGRVILHVSDVDALYRRARAAGLHPSRVPQDAPWGERFFHISDPDGHELSFARLLDPNTP